MMRLLPALLALLLPAAFAADPAPAPAPAPAPVSKPAAPTQSLKKQLTATPLTEITIPSFTTDQTTLGDAIAVLTQQVKKNSKNGLELQWVYRNIDAEKWPHTVTLVAKDKPAGKILNEIAAQAKVEVKLEEHAIVIRPLGSGKAEVKAPAPAPVRTSDVGKNSVLDRPTLDTKGVESSYIDDQYDKTPVKGRNPIKKPAK